MKRAMLFVLLFGIVNNLSAIPHGQVLEGLSIKSSLMNKAVNYSVYLPADYDASTRSYPVVYLLHGYTDNETAWVQYGEVNLAADAAIESREIPPMIIIMPDGGLSFYINNFDNSVPWEDMFMNEFIPAMESQYRIRPGKEFRGISGLSMGGWGTLMFAMRYPDMFAACAAFSAAVWTDEEFITIDKESYHSMCDVLFGKGLEGEARRTALYKSRHSLDMARTLPTESLTKVRYYIDCGDNDFLIKGNCALHLTLKDRNIPHDFRVRAGEHNWYYWRTGIKDGLKFIGQSFNR